MKHIESTLEIYYSDEYARFKMINGNRQLNESKIKRIIEEIESGNDMLKYYPIQVRENKDRLDIIDGQHRFYICKKLKRPVYYILVKEEKSMPEIARVNSNVEKWKSVDFINCYVAHDNSNYKILQAFLDKYQISTTVALIMLSKGNPGCEGAYPEMGDSFRSGTFEVKFKENAEQLADTCLHFDRFPNYRSRPFIIAIYRILKAGIIPIEDLISAYNKRPEMLTQQGNYKAYITNLEQIINVGKQKRIVII